LPGEIRAEAEDGGAEVQGSRGSGGRDIVEREGSQERLIWRVNLPKSQQGMAENQKPRGYCAQASFFGQTVLKTVSPFTTLTVDIG
jgi:hypothetical protein